MPTPKQLRAASILNTAPPAGALTHLQRSACRPVPHKSDHLPPLVASVASHSPSRSLNTASPNLLLNDKTRYSKTPLQQYARMSTMPASHGHNEACCNIPPVVATGYDKKGDYTELGGYKTYVTGPEEAEKGIVVIYDIFGYFDQTLQGADILAYSDKHTKHKVFMPDWFEGKPVPIEWYPPKTDEQKKNLGAFFEKHSPPSVAEQVPGYVKALQEKNPGIKSWAILGYCWGGKVVSLVTSGSSNPFKVAAECHPAMVEPKEAEGIKIPLIMLASKEEPADKVKEFESKLNVPKHVETFGDQVHGWMAARGDLKDPRVKEEYTRAYKTVLEFFGKNWQ